jgi:NADH-quinone oxidoreductase subunit D
MEEMRQSVRIVRQAVEKLPEGPIMAKVPKVLKPPLARRMSRSKRPKASLAITS